ncbi:MAG: hypothetical protein ACJ8J0_14650 [Longimicrobiaceae bacterium]
MKRFAASCLALGVIVWAADRASGAALERMLPATTTDLRSGMELHPEVAVLGSSRAVYHYAADTLQGRLGVRVYNFGRSGQASPLFHRAVGEMLLAEHPPRLLVLEVDASSVAGPDDLSRLAVLLPYWRRYPAVKEVVLRRSRFERVKLLSRAYPYNSLVLNMVVQRLRRRGEPRLGFRTLHGRADGAGGADAATEETPLGPGGMRPEATKVRAVACLVAAMRGRGARVVAVRSPRLLPSAAARREAAEGHRLLAGVLGAMRVPFIDFEASPGPAFRDPAYFRDVDHLNEEGATRFTRELADSLRPYLAAAGGPGPVPRCAPAR